jgi:hypothetical protein
MQITILSSAITIGCKAYENLKCKGAEFGDCIMDDENLIKYLQNNGATIYPHIALSNPNLAKDKNN